MSINVPKELILDFIGDELSLALSEMGGFSHMEQLHDGKTIADATTKIFIYNKKHEKVAFLLCNYSKYGDIGRRNIENNQEAKTRLGKKSSLALLSPILVGEVKGVEYSVWPYCDPLGNELNFIQRKIQLYQVRPLIFEWLRNMNEDSLLLASQNEVVNNFVHPLQQLFKKANISLEIKKEISRAVDCLENNSWKPYFVLAHNDFWSGNVLCNKRHASVEYKGVTVIDWAGSNYKGFAIYDLVRISMSMNVSRVAFRGELEAHCALLHCDKRNAMGYLLASFAWLFNNLGAFPEERCIKLLDGCYKFLSEKS